MLTLSKKNTKEALLKKSKIEVLLKICRSVYVYAIEGAISIFQSEARKLYQSDESVRIFKSCLSQKTARKDGLCL